LLRKFGVVAIKVRHKITPEMLSWVTTAAHAQGLSVTGHLSATNATQAAASGIDGLEHASGVADAAAESPNPVGAAKGIRAFLDDLRGFTRMSEHKETALIKLLVDKKVTLIPTLGIRRRAVLEDYRPAVEEDDKYARTQALAYVPQQVRKEWSESVLDKTIRQSFSKEETQTMREGYRRLEQFVVRFARSGGVVLAGSDTLNGVAGLTFHREVESLVLAGLKPMEGLLAATRDAAKFLKRDDLGTLEAGKTADVLILGANPLEEIRNLRKIEKVFQNGRELDFGFHPDYVLPPPRPELVRPLFVERLLAKEN
jgi:imidazolonepropionase-like amidohydrolase